MAEDSGRVTGSREPSPSSCTAGLHPSGFDPARFWPPPWTATRPEGEEMVEILDAHGRTIARLEWPFHSAEEGEDAERATYTLSDMIANLGSAASGDLAQQARREAALAEMARLDQEMGLYDNDQAIATEARRAETPPESGGSVHEGAGPKGIAQSPPPNPGGMKKER